MPIHVPGKRNYRKQRIQSAKRNIVATLQLTAMVDMFTVLVIFLLQNYASTNQILPISDQIKLPEATAVKELKPSFVVILSEKFLLFNDKKVASFYNVKSNSKWLIDPLLDEVQKAIEKSKGTDAYALSDEKTTSPYYKITLQVDKSIDFLSVKKVLYTLAQAGVQEINFAVVKVKSDDKYNL